MAPKLVFVRFKEDSVHWVVTLDDVKDFLPKHSDDFDPKKIYPTRWPHLKETAGSFDINEFHDAYIICLGVDEVDIAFKAKQLKKFNKLPIAIITAFKEHENEGKVTGKEQVKAAQEKKESSKEINAKDARRVMVSRSRMKASLDDDVKDNLKDNVKHHSKDKDDAKDKGKAREKDKEKVREKNKEKVKEKDKGKVKVSKEQQRREARQKKEKGTLRFQEGLAALLDCHLVGTEEPESDLAFDVQNPSLLASPNELQGTLVQKESGLKKSESVHVEGTPKKATLKHVQVSKSRSPCSISLKDELKGMPLKHSGFIVTPLKEDQDDVDLDDTLPITDDKEISSLPNSASRHLFTSDDEEPKLKKHKGNSDLYDADTILSFSKIEVNKPKENPQTCQGESDSDDADTILACSKIEVNKPKENPQTYQGDSDSKESDSSSADVEVPKLRGMGKGIKRKKESDSDDSESLSSYTPSEEMIKKSQELIMELQSKVSMLQRNEKKHKNQLSDLQTENEELKAMNLDLQRKLYKVEKDSKKMGKESKSLTSKMTREEIKSSPELQSHETPNIKKEKPKSSRKHGQPSISEKKSNQEIGDMLHKAISNPEDHPLREDGSGMVNLGNNVWVPKNVFEEKLSKLSVRTSIAVGDLMEYIWGKEGMASRSLDGGVSPKTPEASRKTAATPAKKEVVLGFYRARKMIDGLKDTQGLDMAVDMEGKKILREKFSRCAKSVKKAQADTA